MRREATQREGERERQKGGWKKVERGIYGDSKEMMIRLDDYS